MKEKQIALYARVSSEQQAEAQTIESQLAEKRQLCTKPHKNSKFVKVYPKPADKD